jgi:ferredoxin
MPLFSFTVIVLQSGVRPLPDMLSLSGDRGPLFKKQVGPSEDEQNGLITGIRRDSTMKSAKIISFSPTGTTRRVLEGIAQGLAAQTVEHLDLTPARARTGTIRELDRSLALIGTPVYAGRVPIQAAEALSTIKTAGAPAILVVVYGNRAYEDALLELKGIVEEVGFRPLAGAAFVGEHSYSTETIPIAAGRPDKEDIEKARSFGGLVREMLQKRGSLREVPALDVPGNFPYRDRVSLGTSLESGNDLCVRCGKCGEVCPQEAITVGEDGIATDRGKCILCCACVKTCTTGARRLTHAKIPQYLQMVAALCRDRKEPEFFFPK